MKKSGGGRETKIVGEPLEGAWTKNITDVGEAEKMFYPSVKVLTQDGFDFIKNHGELPPNSSTYRDWFAKSNSKFSTFYPKGITEDQVTEMAAAAFSNPGKIWNESGTAWTSEINLKGKIINFAGYGTKASSIEDDLLKTGFITDVN